MFWVVVQSISAQGHRIQVKVDGIKDSKCYLGYYYGNSEFMLDSTEIGEEGYFIFQSESPLPKGIYFVHSPNFFFEILVADQKFSVDTRSPNFVNAMITHGSEENRVYNQLQRFGVQQQNLISSLPLSLAEVDSGNALVRELKKIEEASRDFQKELAQKHSGTYVSKIILAMMEPEVPDNLEGPAQYLFLKEHFFDNLDFSEPALLRTPVVGQRLEAYLDELTYQVVDSVIQSIDFIMGKVKGYPQYYRFTVSFLARKYEKVNSQIFLHVAQNHILGGDNSWMSPEFIRSVKRKVDLLTPKNEVGDLAPNFSLIDPTFNQITLFSIPASYIILYFYDPDCGHCKTAGPILFDVYQKYRKKGLEVVGICITTDVNQWVEYIEENEWDWINGADPYYQSGFREDYKVLTAPMIYVLDKNKEIIASNVQATDLESFLKTLNF